MSHSQSAPVLALCILAAGAVYPASAATYSAVAYMTSQNAEPLGIAEASPGVFLVQAGGTLIFSVTSQGVTTILASFADPPYTVESAPGATAANSLFYSSIAQTRVHGGSGNMLSVSPILGSEKTYPGQVLSLGPVAGNLPSGNLFGLVYNFSNATNAVGTSDVDGHMAVTYQFPGTDRPAAPIYGADGNYYGTASTYGTHNGYFYKVTPAGSFTRVATLPFQGDGIVLQGTDGNFYGVQGPDCTTQHGSVYKMTPAGKFTTLHDFGLCGNATVNSLVQGSDDKLYGVTQGNDLIFSLTTRHIQGAIPDDDR